MDSINVWFDFYWNIHSILNILTTFNKACNNGHLEVVKILLKNRADQKIKNNKGETALDLGERTHVPGDKKCFAFLKIINSWYLPPWYLGTWYIGHYCDILTFLIIE